MCPFFGISRNKHKIKSLFCKSIEIQKRPKIGILSSFLGREAQLLRKPAVLGLPKQDSIKYWVCQEFFKK